MVPRYSIVIPAKNVQSTLPTLLSCLDAQTYPHNAFECIIVNDGSNDGTSSVLESWKSDIELHTITHPATYGRSFSRNAGWQKARGEIIVFLDADMLPVPELLSGYEQCFTGGIGEVVSGERYCLKHHIKQGEYTSASSFIAEAKSLSQPGQQLDEPFADLELSVRTAVLRDPEGFISVFSAIASNMAVRRDWLDRVDGFNPFLPSFEDIELGMRLWEAGARFSIAPEAAAYHNPVISDTSGHWLTGDEACRLFLRHPYRPFVLAALHGRRRISGNENHKDSLADVLAPSNRADQSSLKDEFEQRFGVPLPVNCTYTFEMAVDGYVQRIQEPIEAVRMLIAEAFEKGLYSETRDGVRYFDMHRTVSHLVSGSPKWGLDSLILGLTRRRTPFEESKNPDDAISYRCKGTYEITIPADVLREHGGAAKMNIALPMEHACQTGMVIKNHYPDDLMRYVDRRNEMILRYPVAAGSDPEVKIGYEFECVLHEFVPGRFAPGSIPAGSVLPEHTRPGIPHGYLESAQTILRQVIQDTDIDAFEKARAIYNWAWYNFEFQEVGTPYLYSLQSGYGACIQRSRVCLALLRLAGIPAREQCGVHFNMGSHTPGPQVKTQRIIGTTPFLHSWIEFYTDSHGWTPYREFLPVTRYAAIAAASEPLREEIRRRSWVCRDDFFGSMDPYRLYGSTQANKLPMAPIVKTAGGWTASAEVAARTVHLVTVHLTESHK